MSACKGRNSRDAVAEEDRMGHRGYDRPLADIGDGHYVLVDVAPLK